MCCFPNGNFTNDYYQESQSTYSVYLHFVSVTIGSRVHYKLLYIGYKFDNLNDKEGQYTINITLLH